MYGGFLGLSGVLGDELFECSELDLVINYAEVFLGAFPYGIYVAEPDDTFLYLPSCSVVFMSLRRWAAQHFLWLVTNLI